MEVQGEKPSVDRDVNWGPAAAPFFYGARVVYFLKPEYVEYENLDDVPLFHDFAGCPLVRGLSDMMVEGWVVDYNDEPENFTIVYNLSGVDAKTERIIVSNRAQLKLAHYRWTAADESTSWEETKQEHLTISSKCAPSMPVQKLDPDNLLRDVALVVAIEHLMENSDVCSKPSDVDELPWLLASADHMVKVFAIREHYSMSSCWNFRRAFRRRKGTISEIISSHPIWFLKSVIALQDAQAASRVGSSSDDFLLSQNCAKEKEVALVLKIYQYLLHRAAEKKAHDFELGVTNLQTQSKTVDKTNNDISTKGPVEDVHHREEKFLNSVYGTEVELDDGTIHKLEAADLEVPDWSEPETRRYVDFHYTYALCFVAASRELRSRANGPLSGMMKGWSWVFKDADGEQEQCKYEGEWEQVHAMFCHPDETHRRVSKLLANEYNIAGDVVSSWIGKTEKLHEDITSERDIRNELRILYAELDDYSSYNYEAARQYSFKAGQYRMFKTEQSAMNFQNAVHIMMKPVYLDIIIDFVKQNLWKWEYSRALCTRIATITEQVEGKAPITISELKAHDSHDILLAASALVAVHVTHPVAESRSSSTDKPLLSDVADVQDKTAILHKLVDCAERLLTGHSSVNIMRLHVKVRHDASKHISFADHRHGHLPTKEEGTVYDIMALIYAGLLRRRMDALAESEASKKACENAALNFLKFVSKDEVENKS